MKPKRGAIAGAPFPIDASRLLALFRLRSRLGLSDLPLVIALVRLALAVLGVQPATPLITGILLLDPLLAIIILHVEGSRTPARTNRNLSASFAARSP